MAPGSRWLGSRWLSRWPTIIGQQRDLRVAGWWAKGLLRIAALYVSRCSSIRKPFICGSPPTQVDVAAVAGCGE